jgi:hypothetical protein
VGDKLPLEIPVEYLSPRHGLVQLDTRDVPPANHKVVGVHHRQHLRDGHVDGRGADERADVVGLLDAVLGVPRDVVLVGEVSRHHGRAVVPADTDEQETGGSAERTGARRRVTPRHGSPDTANLGLCKELVGVLGLGDLEPAVGSLYFLSAPNQASDKRCRPTHW